MNFDPKPLVLPYTPWEGEDIPQATSQIGIFVVVPKT